ncbi:hypothetical protein CJF42_00900 [Pseudoalteromonas sp. NBT06-2]|uniref:hypothetical protein n=1 Tax=Pseudoalteromonas sp. NBT06-2 TaxID=2025950 RepID=UPI000BA70D17|nr:hypothetical protein [Pseudoalteromonas sp. NBT06-2]PAJ76280.1 hypothetical protein CJF42_00900 [Pseudoalteromonas sp. NBT06-2]
MFNKLIALYTKGDLAQLSSSILHSTSWKQHDFTAYGHMQIESQWLKSLQQFGFLQLKNQQTVKSDKFSALYFELAADSANRSISLSFFFEHNQTHIKKLHCIVDSLLSTQFKHKDVSKLIKQLPAVDPLQLSQFDHQLHPQSYHAIPSDFCDLPEDTEALLNQWWHIWQEKQFADFELIYNAKSKINIAGLGNSNGYKSLRTFHINMHNRINRSYCQIENICYDSQQNTVAIQWQIEGDYLLNGDIKRIRVPVLSFITIKDNVIVQEQLQIDWLSLCKRFQLTYPVI